MFSVIIVAFTESYSKAKFAEHGLDFDFVQDNHSLSTEAGVLRGLHFQKAKLRKPN